MADKILVTGITGRVGANLAKALADRGYEVRGLVLPDDPKIRKLKHLKVDIVPGDLLDPDSLHRAVEGVDLVADIAAVVGRPKGMNEASYFEANVNGKFNLMEAIARDGHVRRVVHASSVATYTSFNAVYTPTDEEHPQRPFFPYALVKTLAETTVWSYSRQEGIPTTVLRYEHIDAGDEVLECYTAHFIASQLRYYGANPNSSIYVEGVDEPWRAVEAAVESGQQLTIPRAPDGRTWLWCPCDVRDIVQGTLLALESPGAVGEAFNIGGPRTVTWEEAVKYISCKTGQPYLEVGIPNLWIFETSIAKARRLLSYRPQYDIYRMVDSALAMRAGKDIGVLPT